MMWEMISSEPNGMLYTRGNDRVCTLPGKSLHSFGQNPPLIVRFRAFTANQTIYVPTASFEKYASRADAEAAFAIAKKRGEVEAL